MREEGLTESLCDMCGGNHAVGCCSIIREAKTVKNSKTLSFARQSLPEDLELFTLADGSEAVRTKTAVSKHTLYGPFEARSDRVLHPAITFPLKVFVSSSNPKSLGYYYLDTTSEATSNWMRFVRGSVTGFTKWREQNLMCYQISDNIYYMTIREVMADEELKVAYSPNYAKRMGLPASLVSAHGTTAASGMAWMKRASVEAAKHIVSLLPETALGVPNARQQQSAWACAMCDCKAFDTVMLYAAHLREHYKAAAAGEATKRRSNKVKCPGCDTVFYQKTEYEKHCCALTLNGEHEDMDTPEELDPAFDPGATGVNIHLGDNSGILNESLDNLLREFEDTAVAVADEYASNDDPDDEDLLYSVDPRQLNKISPIKYPDGIRAPGARLVNYDSDAFLFDQHDEMSCFSTSTAVDGATADGNGRTTKECFLGDERCMFSGVELFGCSTRENGLLNQYGGDAGKGAGNRYSRDMNEGNVDGKLFNMLGENGKANVYGRVVGDSGMENGYDGDAGEVSSQRERTILKELVVALGGTALEDPINLETRGDGMETENEPFAFDMDTSVNGDKCLAGGDKGLADVSFTRVIEELPNAEIMMEDDLSFLQAVDGGESNGRRPDDDEEQSESQQQEETGGGFNCDICTKRFANKMGLYRHLQKHTGNFTCPTCFIVFARNETLVKHACVKKAYILDKAVVVPPLRCDLCDQTFTTRNTRALNKHIKSKHMGMWRCKDCHMTFSSKNYLRQHPCKAVTHTPTDTPVTCPHCSMPFSASAYLRKHVARIHGLAVACKTCGKHVVGNPAHAAFCAEASQLEGEGVAKCPTCYHMFVDVGAYREHVLAHTHDQECEKCRMVFVSKRAKRMHPCGLMSCDVCQHPFVTFLELKEHSSSHGVAGWHCFECGFSYHSEESLSGHDCNARGFLPSKPRPTPATLSTPATPTTLTEARPFVCDVCGSHFKSKLGLVGHVHAAHEEAKFQCQVCDKKFRRLDLLQFHRSSHDKPKIPCPHPGCSSVLRTTKILATHMRQHEPAKAYRCSTCDRGFHQKSLLVTHRAVHHPDEATADNGAAADSAPKQCDLCDKPFRSAFYLRQHRLCHGDDSSKVHKCTAPRCNKAYVTARLLQAHVSVAHTNRRYVCPECHKVIAFKSSMKRHLIQVHQVKSEDMNQLLASIHTELKDLPFVYSLDEGGDVDRPDAEKNAADDTAASGGTTAVSTTASVGDSAVNTTAYHANTLVGTSPDDTTVFDMNTLVNTTAITTAFDTSALVGTTAVYTMAFNTDALVGTAGDFTPAFDTNAVNTTAFDTNPSVDTTAVTMTTMDTNAVVCANALTGTSSLSGGTAVCTTALDATAMDAAAPIVSNQTFFIELPSYLNPTELVDSTAVDNVEEC